MNILLLLFIIIHHLKSFKFIHKIGYHIAFLVLKYAVYFILYSYLDSDYCVKIRSRPVERLTHHGGGGCVKKITVKISVERRTNHRYTIVHTLDFAIFTYNIKALVYKIVI